MVFMGEIKPRKVRRGLGAASACSEIRQVVDGPTIFGSKHKA